MHVCTVKKRFPKNIHSNLRFGLQPTPFSHYKKEKEKFILSTDPVEKYFLGILLCIWFWFGNNLLHLLYETKKVPLLFIIDFIFLFFFIYIFPPSLGLLQWFNGALCNRGRPGLETRVFRPFILKHLS